jgi:hypothetical protein
MIYKILFENFRVVFEPVFLVTSNTDDQRYFSKNKNLKKTVYTLLRWVLAYVRWACHTLLLEGLHPVTCSTGQEPPALYAQRADSGCWCVAT